MVARVLVGNRGGNYGLWVSKPTYDVSSTAQSNMLFSMDGRLTQVLARGSITFPANASGQTQSVALSGTNGVVPMAIVWYAYQANTGTMIVPFNTNVGASVTLTATTFAITMNANLLSGTLYEYTLLLES